MPAHGPQADSRMRAPAAMRSAKAPLRAIICRTCRDPGLTTRFTRWCTVRPLSMSAMVIRSLYEELVQLPTATWLTGMPSTSLIGQMLSGLDGCAISGSRVSRSIRMCSS